MFPLPVGAGARQGHGSGVKGPGAGLKGSPYLQLIIAMRKPTQGLRQALQPVG